jgi:hypothetical protein
MDISAHIPSVFWECDGCVSLVEISPARGLLAFKPGRPKLAALSRGRLLSSVPVGKNRNISIASIASAIHRGFVAVISMGYGLVRVSLHWPWRLYSEFLKLG